VEETSAGGLVVDRTEGDPRVALIGRVDRRGRLLWSLPKGHLEDGETAEDAAIREVEEETGIRGRVVASLGTIDYWFVAEDRRIHKTVHHYLLEAAGGELSDADVEVDEVAWVPLGELATGVGPENASSYPSAGQLLLYPGGLSETEILFPYGATCFASKMGQLAGNHFATIVDGGAELAELGRLVIWEGAQDVRFAEA